MNSLDVMPMLKPLVVVKLDLLQVSGVTLHGVDVEEQSAVDVPSTMTLECQVLQSFAANLLSALRKLKLL